MPHLEIKNVKKEDFIAKVPALSKELTEIIGCPEDWITISYTEGTLTFVEGIDRTYDNVFVEIKWFARPDEMKQKVAQAIDKAFKADGRDIMVNFVTLTKDSYLENGDFC